jgi:hypothetical protein
MRQQRIALFRPAPEDRLVRLQHVSKVSQQSIERFEILRGFRALDRQHYLPSQSAGGHWLTGSGATEMRVEASNSTLSASLRAYGAPTVQVGK